MPTSITSGNPPARSDFGRVRFDEFELDEANALLLRGGSAIALSPTPFGLLCALARHPGALLTKHALLDEVWGHRFVSNSVLKGAISDVRTVLDDDPQHPRFIETVPRRGYRFIAVSTVLSAESPPSVSASLMRPESHVTEQASASARTLTVEPTPVLFVGRAKELASLRRAWDRVTSGKRVVFWIAGEPGTGKTTLIDRFVSGLGEIACARGHCLQHYGSGEPYHPVLEALAELCRSDTAVPPLLRAVAPTWLLQLPWLSTVEQREALLRELVGVNLERMLREMGEFLDRYTERRPLLLVTEDVHWGDRATIQLMDYIARRRGNGRLMWLASFRPTEIILHDHPFKALRNELRLHGLCEEIVLDPFSEKEVAEYVAQRAPSFAASEGFVRALHERADGLPLLVNHVMNDLIARGTLGGDDASAPLRLGRIAIPENLAGIIDQYVARLANEQRVVLEAAAVCGSEFRVGAVAAALERDAASVAVIRDELARGHLRLSPSLAEDRTTVVRPWPRCVTTRRPPSRPYCTSARLKR